MKPSDYNERQFSVGLLTWEKISKIVQHWQADNDLTADGYYGPASDAAFTRQFGAHNPPARPSPLGAFAVTVAEREIGNGEEGRNNAGRHLARYRDYPHGDDLDRPVGEWCAFFAGYCIEQAVEPSGIAFDRRFYDRARNRRMPIGSAKSLGRRALREGGREVPVNEITRGDLVVWNRGKAGTPSGHVALCSDTDGESFWTIDGNIGRYPAKVKTRSHLIERPGDLVMVVRLPGA